MLIKCLKIRYYTVFNIFKVFTNPCAVLSSDLSKTSLRRIIRKN